MAWQLAIAGLIGLIAGLRLSATGIVAWGLVLGCAAWGSASVAGAGHGMAIVQACLALIAYNGTIALGLWVRASGIMTLDPPAASTEVTDAPPTVAARKSA